MAYNVNEERLKVRGSEQITRDLKVNRDLFVNGTADTKNLTVEDDATVKGEAIFEDDVAIHGDLYVEGTTTTTSEAQVSSSGNYVVTRDNNATPLATGEYSGLAVNNYTTGKIATITADKEGTWRISDSATASATTYTNISAYNGVYYTGLSQTTTTGPSGILTNVDADELASVVKNGSSYYHKAGNDWFGPVTLVNNALNIGSIITDATLIATLNGLTKNDLVYYRSAVDKTIDSSTNQPLLTRNEAANLTNNNLLAWDSTNTRAIDSGISKTVDSTPTANSTNLVTSGGVKNYVDNSINALDVSSVGGNGKYISAISEANGKISATATTMDTAPTASSTKAATSGGIKTAIDTAETNAKCLDNATGILSETHGGTGQNCLANVTVGCATNATNSTCFGGCTYSQACTNIRSGLTSCTGTVTVSNSTSSSAVPLALCTGATAIGKSSCCSLTYIPTTGVLTTSKFCGNLCGVATRAGYATCLYNRPASTTASATCNVYFYTGKTDASCVATNYCSCICGTNGYFYGNVCGNVCGTANQACCSYKTAFTSSADRPVMIACPGSAAFTVQGISTCCPLTFNPATGVLKAAKFCGTVDGTISSADNATCFNGCTFAQACTTIRSGLTSCTGTVTVSNVSTGDCPVALCTGATKIGKSTGCSLAFNAATGVLTANCFCGTASNLSIGTLSLLLDTGSYCLNLSKGSNVYAAPNLYYNNCDTCNGLIKSGANGWSLLGCRVNCGYPPGSPICTCIGWYGSMICADSFRLGKWCSGCGCTLGCCTDGSYLRYSGCRLSLTAECSSTPLFCYKACRTPNTPIDITSISFGFNDDLIGCRFGNVAIICGDGLCRTIAWACGALACDFYKAIKCAFITDEAAIYNSIGRGIFQSCTSTITINGNDCAFSCQYMDPYIGKKMNNYWKGCPNNFSSYSSFICSNNIYMLYCKDSSCVCSSFVYLGNIIDSGYGNGSYLNSLFSSTCCANCCTCTSGWFTGIIR